MNLRSIEVKEMIIRYQKNTGLIDAVQTGICKITKINNNLLAIAVMEPSFIRGSMGVVVGEKISCAISMKKERICSFIVFYTKSS